MTPTNTLPARDELALLDARRAELLRELQQAGAASPNAAPANPNATGVRIPLDITEAIPVCFTVDIVDDARAQDKSFVGKNAWIKGVRNAKGPKGGVYVNGRVVIGFGAAQRKGWLKVGDRHFPVLEQGGPMDAWVQFDGEKSARLIGVFMNYQPKTAPAPAAS